MKEPTIRDVSDTSLWVATYRALESERPDALFRDPWAGKLAGERGRTIAKKMKGSRYTAWSVVIRTCVIDAFIHKLVTEGVDTILNLGAGLDTRPYRLTLPSSLRWIEVDYAHIIELKEKTLHEEKPTCHLERIRLDLANRDARQQLFGEIGSRSRKVLVITEGVLPYLTNEQVAELATDLRSQKTFSYWIVDYFSAEVLKHLHSAKRKQQMGGAPFQFAPANWTEFFAELRWKPREFGYIGEASKRLGRTNPLPWWVRVMLSFASEKRRERLRKMMAYVILEQT